jgi:hypothetical protein
MLLQAGKNCLLTLQQVQQLLHADAEEVAETHLSDVIGDVLVVLEVSSINFSVTGGDLDIRLAVC